MGSILIYAERERETGVQKIAKLEKEIGYTLTYKQREDTEEV